MPIYKDGKDTSKIRSHVALLPPTVVSESQAANQQLEVYSLKTTPSVITEYEYGYAPLSIIPVGAKITKIIFYGYTADATSILVFTIYRQKGLDGGSIQEDQLYTSGNLTGEAGWKSASWTPSPAEIVLDMRTYSFRVSLYSTAVKSNAQHLAVRIEYEY